jgi:hypothetical protein
MVDVTTMVPVFAPTATTAQRATSMNCVLTIATIMVLASVIHSVQKNVPANVVLWGLVVNCNVLSRHCRVPSATTTACVLN